MDLLANIEEQERIVASKNPDVERLKELVDALDEWFARGGFIPDGYSPMTLRAQRDDAMRVLRAGVRSRR